ncbi:MAG TPA: hypothetical protein VME41_01945 [Stellaceae bacterium]|nr:hypothetical protein [Stellaceae bacterium]
MSLRKIAAGAGIRTGARRIADLAAPLIRDQPFGNQSRAQLRDERAGRARILTPPRSRRPATPDLTALAAARLIESRGPDALRILADRAEFAAERGHRVAAATWRDMADAAAHLLRIEREPAVMPPGLACRLPRIWLR